MQWYVLGAMFLCCNLIVVCAYMVGAAKTKRKFVDPELFEHHGETGKAIYYAALLIEALLFVTALFSPVRSGWAFFWGLGIVAVGLLIGVTAAYTRGSAEDGLIKSGLYGYSRNPILLGRAVWLIGFLVMGLSNDASYQVFFLAALSSFFVWKLWVDKEEEFYEARHGEDYADYKRWVPRFFLCW